MKTRLGYRHTVGASYIGYITQAIANNFAPLLFVTFHDAFGLPLSRITMLITVNFLIQLTVDLLSAKFIDKIGYRICIVAAHVFAAVGIASMSLLPFILPPFCGLLISVCLYAVGGGLIEVLISSIVEACPSDNKASGMSLLHSFYCWGTVAVILITTLYLTVFGRESWRALAVVWSLVPAANAVFFSLVPIAKLTEAGEGMKVGELLGNKIFWLFIALIFASGASEQAMSQWASAFAESGLGVSKTMGDLAGPCMFSVLMGISRVFYAKKADKINLLSFILMSGGLCIVSYILASFSSSPVLSLVGCALCGLSVGIMWPGVYSISSAAFPRGGTAMFALLALGGDLGCSAGPTLVGFVSGLFDDSLKTGVAAGIAFPIILVLCGLIYKRKNKADNT